MLLPLHMRHTFTDPYMRLSQLTPPLARYCTCIFFRCIISLNPHHNPYTCSTDGSQKVTEMAAQSHRARTCQQYLPLIILLYSDQRKFLDIFSTISLQKYAFFKVPTLQYLGVLDMSAFT